MSHFKIKFYFRDVWHQSFLNDTSWKIINRCVLPWQENINLTHGMQSLVACSEKYRVWENWHLNFKETNPHVRRTQWHPPNLVLLTNNWNILMSSHEMNSDTFSNISSLTYFRTVHLLTCPAIILSGSITLEVNDPAIHNNHPGISNN
jgi:hypothetical protein